MNKQFSLIKYSASILGLLLFFVSAQNNLIFSQWLRHGPGPNTKGQVENITDQEVVGAIHAVAPHPINPDIMYVGVVNGGIWMTANARAANPNWVQQTDNQESLSIGALEFDPTDASRQTLVAGIGRFSAFGRRGGERNGLLRTVDGGANWASIDGGGTLTGLNISGVASRGNTIVISVNDADIFANRGIWRSTNTGTNWTQISGGAGTGLPAGASYDLTGDPGNQSCLFTNAGTNGVYRSIDAGATWTKVSDAAVDALISGVTNNIEIAVGTSNNVFVAIVNNGRLGGLFRSSDSGATWTDLDLPITTEDGAANFGIHPGSQGSIHLSIAADPANSNIVYIGGDRQPYFTEGSTQLPPYFPNSIGANNFSGRLFRVDASQPAGSQASHLTHSNTSSNSSPHADSRDMALDTNGDLIEVDDGGIYRRTSPQSNAGDWFSMNGDIQTTEFHDIAWDSNSKIVIGGAQDTGTPEELLPTNVRWQSVSQADGGDVGVDDISTPGLSIRYSSSQYLGGFRRRTYNAANVLQSQVYPALTETAGSANLVAPFYTPIHLNTLDPTRLIIGGAISVYESLDQGDTITEIGPGIVVNSSGRNPIAYGASDNADILYTGAVNQVFVRTAADPAPLTASAAYVGGNVADIAIDPDNSQVAFVIDVDSVFQTTDAGASWTDVTGNLQTLDPGDLRSIVYCSSNIDGSVAVGGDNGVFIASGPAFTNWNQLGNDLPEAPVYDLEYDPIDEILLAGTLGRGAWTINLAERDPVDIMLVLDISGSMLNEACAAGCEPKLDVLKDAVEIFINLWTAIVVPDDRLGVNYFRTNIDEFDIGGTVLLPVIDNASAMITDVRSQTTVGSNLTAMGGGLQSAINRLDDDTRPRNIILFTDGMQNVNPKVLEIDDSPPPDAFHLEIDNDPLDSDISNVNPTTPATRVDNNLGIKISTIGVGATEYFIDLLDKIASETGGLFKQTTAPDEDLRRFYVEDLIDVLKNFSPQLLAYRYGQVNAAAADETFAVNRSVRRVILKLSWKRGDKMSFQVEKDGVDVTRIGQIINGPFYRIFYLDVPTEVQGEPVSAGGNWIMRISGNQGAKYEAAVIVDEPSLKYEYSIKQNDYIVGDTLVLNVNVSYGGLPVTDANVSARVLKPRKGLGTLLSINSTPPEPAGFKYELGVTEAQRKLQLLLMNNDFYSSIQPEKYPLTFQNNGNGNYSAQFKTDYTGTYSAIFNVEGERSDTGKYQRTEARSTMVRFGQAVISKSDVYKTLLRESNDGRHYLLYVRPIDQYGNYLGPDYGNKIDVSINANSMNDKLKDEVDGGYAVQFFVAYGANPNVSVKVMGKQLYNGPLSSLPFKKKHPYALSVHAGVTLPIGTFNNGYDPGYLTEVDFEYKLNNMMSLEGILGRYAFDSAYKILGGSLYFKSYLSAGNWKPYAALGAGIYKPDNLDAAFGITFGAGISKSISQQLWSDLGAYFFHLFSTGDSIDFFGVKVGLRYLF